jgi:aminopeptidase-like protein
MLDPADDYLAKTIHALWRLPRDLVSDGFDQALSALSRDVPMTIHEYPSGSECFTWIVPEKWACDEAFLETMDGRCLFSYADNPLHVMSYSQPFEGVVTRDVLLEHLFVHPRLPEAIPFQFSYYKSAWGLCCPQTLRETLNDEAYRVVIRTRFSPGTLKVGEVVIPGGSDDAIVLCAHLCHPHMVNDDLTGVVAGVDIMRTLLTRGNLRYTYRLVLLPETIGSAAYLSHSRNIIPSMKGGIFLEMLGTGHPHALQRSLAGNSTMDLVAEMVMRELDSEAWTGEFLSVILNDERMFNSQGVNVPMVSLSRVLPAGHPDRPYREYHTSLDTPERVDWQHLAASRDLVLRIIDALEANRTPRLRYYGELFCSRYPRINYRLMRDLIHSVPYYVDGRRTIAEIAAATEMGFFQVTGFLDVLEAEGLLDYVPDEPLRSATVADAGPG